MLIMELVRFALFAASRGSTKIWMETKILSHRSAHRIISEKTRGSRQVILCIPLNDRTRIVERRLRPEERVNDNEAITMVSNVTTERAGVLLAPSLRYNFM